MTLARTVTFLTLVTLVAIPAVALKDVVIDYDRDYAASPESFTWVDSEFSLKRDDYLMHSRIKNGIEHYLSQGGLAEVDENPDLYVTYHTSTAAQIKLDPALLGYGYPVGWGWNTHWVKGSDQIVSSHTRIYTKGTLIVDVWDAHTKELVWRGTASGTVAKHVNKVEKQIDDALRKMTSEWKKIQRKAAKGRAASSE